METTILNPLQTDGFAFVEFVTNNKHGLSQEFNQLGMVKTGEGKQHDISLFQQGEIRFLLNNCADKASSEFFAKHGNSPLSMGFYVADAEFALAEACSRGAQALTANQDSIWAGIPAIYGIGGSVIYFITRDNAYLQRFILTATDTTGVGLLQIDHLTHNVYRGNMASWADFYSRIFGFREIRYFDIDGKITGLFSKAMTSPCGKIKIPLNESKDDKSQIEEFLRDFNGEGIQHIALTASDIYSSVTKLRSHGVRLLDTPETYYELISSRLPNHGEDLTKLQQLKILIDGTTVPQRKLLLQIFTQNMVGPSFFEIIQRKGDEGFGEGNFKALFDSIELDQMRRGVL
jgi:4-hydroxyphenylpyruvate dioxygenase